MTAVIGGGVARPEIDHDEVPVDYLRALGRDPDDLRGHRRLAGGVSGSGVFRLVFTDRSDAVLKVTTNPAWRDKARREARFYREAAADLPVRVPQLLAVADTGSATCLLLSAAAPAPTPTLWGVHDWLRVARELAMLHRGMQSPVLDRFSWLTRADPISPDQVRAAADCWDRWGCGRIAEPLLQRPSELTAALAALPATVIHGDCHAGNLLVDDTGGFRWADWQEVGIGHGPEDLALLWQRAEFGGAAPPRQAMLEAYAAVREVSSVPALHRAAVAAELQVLLFGWPAHLRHADHERRDRLIRRFRALSLDWAGGGRATTPSPSTTRAEGAR